MQLLFEHFLLTKWAGKGRAGELWVYGEHIKFLI